VAPDGATTSYYRLDQAPNLDLGVALRAAPQQVEAGERVARLIEGRQTLTADAKTQALGRLSGGGAQYGEKGAPSAETALERTKEGEPIEMAEAGASGEASADAARGRHDPGDDTAEQVAQREETRAQGAGKPPTKPDAATGDRLGDTTSADFTEFAVADLLSGPDGGAAAFAPGPAEALAVMTRAFVDPAGWQSAGGTTGLVRVEGDRLLVWSTPEHRAAVATMLDQLRLVLGVALDDEARAGATERQRPGAAGPHVVVHDVRDLVESALPGDAVEPALAETMVANLAAQVVRAVDPMSWRVLGGDVGGVVPFRGLLVVHQSDANHNRIRVLVDASRKAAGLPAQHAADDPALAAARAERAAALAVARIHQVLEPGLWSATAAALARADEGGAEVAADDVLVTVLVDEVAPATREALTAAGLDIEDASDSLPLVVGRVPATRLPDIALVPGVRRVEPTRAVVTR
jgi:hypothetical protein